jgi:uncharacterized protein (TIGR02118 family)
MTKLLTLIKRPEGAERGAFCPEFLEAAREKAEAPGGGRFIVNLVDVPAEEAGLRPGGEPSYDVVVEEWFDDEAEGGTVLHYGPTAGATDVYEVTETAKKEYERDWPDGERSPGIKSFYIARRHKEMTQAQYAAYWSDRHAPLALRVHIGMWRYTQNVVVSARSEGAPHFDGFALLHFRTGEDLRERFYVDDAGRAAIAEDVAKFTSGGRALHTSEYILRSS